SDFSLTRNGSNVDIASLTVIGSGSSYTLDLSSVTALEGNYVLTLNATASAIVDAAGNAFNVDASDLWTTDTTAPTADIVDITPDPRNAGVGVVAINFSESVTGVNISDFSLSRDGGNVNIAGLSVSGSGSSYTIDLSSVTALEGDYVLSLNTAGSGITDAAGNAFQVTASDSWIVDTSAPTPVITAVANPTGSDPFTVTVDFGETVTGFDAGDIQVTGGTVSGPLVDNGNGSYTATIDAAADGFVTINIPANAAQDAAGNTSAVATGLSVLVDTSVPTPVVSTAANPTTADPFTVTIDFGETVSGFTAGDIIVTGGTVAGPVVDNGNGSFTATIDATGYGTVTVGIAANAAQDAAGNNSLAAAGLSVVVNAPGLTSDQLGSISNLFNDLRDMAGDARRSLFVGLNESDNSLTLAFEDGGPGSGYEVSLQSQSEKRLLRAAGSRWQVRTFRIADSDIINNLSDYTVMVTFSGDIVFEVALNDLTERLSKDGTNNWRYTFFPDLVK
ncbi:MAG: Ig-like domain-containing protein, partial [Verrucomicrobiales bacterium]|nr:Ig-like domain-containing protein [Verrucomicrobiales bacterium]